MKILKENYKFIFGLIIGGLFAGYGVYAATTHVIDSSNVGYKDSSAIGASNVQNALDITASNVKDIQTQVDEITKDLGPIQIVGIKGAGFDISDTNTVTSYSYNFGSMEGATDYIAIPSNLQWYVPYNVSISGTTLSFNILSYDSIAHNGRIIFYIIGYKSI